MLPRTMSASIASRCCPASSNRRERASAAVMKRTRNLHRSSSIVASSSSPSATSAASPRPSSPPPLDPSVDARARHNAEQASIFDSAVEAFVETPAEVLPRLERIAEAARPALAAAFGDQPDAPLYPPRVLDVGAGTGCLIPPLLRVAGSERRRREGAAAGEGGAGGQLASSSPLPMDYLAVDVSSGMLDALERIHGAAGQGAGGERGGGEGEERDPSLVLGNLPRIRTWLGDVESVPQFQAPFDACLFNAVFGNVHDQRSSLLAAALLLRPGSGRVVVAHPMGRGWHERLRAADAEIVPHALPQNAEKWAELLRGLPLELVDAAAERGEGRGAAAAAAAAAAGAEGAAGAAAARDGRGGSPPPPPSSSASAAASAPSASSSPRLVIDDEDCYIAVLRVPPARRLPASLYGTSPPPASASPCSAAAGGGGGGGGGGEEGSGGAKQPSLPQLLPQLLPRLPWQERAERGEDGGGGSDRGPRPHPPSPLPPLLLGGTVVKGFGRGSARMGVPTANIDPSPLEEALSGVPDGVYFGWARLLPEESDDPGAGAGRGAEEGGGGGAEGRDGRAHKCVLNIGRRPTFDGENKGVGVLSVEVHVLHEFEEGGKKKEKGEGEGEGGGQQQLVDFCGRELRVVATGFIRPEMRFAGIQALVSRIRSDVATASAALEEKEHAWAKGHGYLWRKKEGE